MNPTLQSLLSCAGCRHAEANHAGTAVLCCAVLCCAVSSPHRFVSDEDRVAINVMQFSCSSSIGAHRAGFPNTPGTPTSSSSSSTTVSQGLALSSEMYGSMENAESVFDGGSLDLLQGNGQQQESGGSGPNQQHYDTCMPLPPYAMRAGPREDIFFDPSTVTAAIMTTGVLCVWCKTVRHSEVLGNYTHPS